MTVPPLITAVQFLLDCFYSSHHYVDVNLQYMVTVYYRNNGGQAVNVKLFDERSTRSEADEFYLMLTKLPNVVGIEYDKSVDDHWVEVTKPVRRNAVGEWVSCANGRARD